MKKQQIKLYGMMAMLLYNFYVILSKIKGEHLSKALQRKYLGLGLGLLAHAVLWSTIVITKLDTTTSRSIFILFGGMALSLLLIIPLYQYRGERNRSIGRSF